MCSHYTFLDDRIPKIQAPILAIKLIIRNNGQLLVNFIPKLRPILFRIFVREMTPEHILNS